MMERLKLGDFVILNKDLTIPVRTVKPFMVHVNQFDTPVDVVFERVTLRKGTLLKVLSNNILAGMLIVAPVNDELIEAFMKSGNNSIKIESTDVDAASPAARLLYGQNDR